MLDNLGVKRVIALALVVGYIIFTAYCLVANKQLPDGYIGILGLVIGYYFSKNNAEAEKEAKSSV